MIAVSIVKEALIEAGRRIIKVLAFGKSDAQTPRETAPFGWDSAPTAGIRAIYAKTSETAKPVIIGYVNVAQLSEPGESRMFATNDEGELQLYVWARKDGTLEVGGDTDSMVRYSELETAFNTLQDAHNDLVERVNKMTTDVGLFAAAYVPGSPTTVGLPPTFVFDNSQETPSNADIKPAKIEEIKTL